MTNQFTTATNTPSSVFSMEKMLELARTLKPMPPPVSVITHDANVPKLKEAFGESESYITHPGLFSVPVISCEHVEKRLYDEEWIPPEGDRFCEYGPEDEHWMRPLGLGTIRKIDRGPAFYMFSDVGYKMMFSPRFDSLLMTGF